MREVVSRIVCHAQSLHDSDGSRVRRHGERHDLVQASGQKPERHRRTRALRRVPSTPMLARKSPSHLDARRERRCEARHQESDIANEIRNARYFDRPEPESMNDPPFG